MNNFSARLFSLLLVLICIIITAPGCTVEISSEISSIYLQAQDSNDSNSNKSDNTDADNDDEASEESIESPSITLSYPSNTRTYIVDDETSIRTATIDHNGSEIECSVGSEDFENCTSDTTLVWAVENYNEVHTIKITHESGETKEESFTPSEQLENLEFVSCDAEVTTAADYSFDDLETLLENNTGVLRVVCLADDVSIESEGGENLIIVPDHNTMLIVRAGETATIINSNEQSTGDDTADRNVNTAILLSSRNNVHLIGLTIITAGRYGHGLLTSGGPSYNSSITHSTITTNGDTAYGIYSTTSLDVDYMTITANGTAARGADFRSGNPATISNSTLTSLNTQAIAFYNNITVDVDNITATSVNSHCAHFSGYNAYSERNVSIVNSTFECGSKGINVTHSGDGENKLLLENSTIKSSSNSLTVTGFGDATINGNTFILLSGGVNSSAIYLYSKVSTNGDNVGTAYTQALVYSDDNDNTFCNESSSDASFTAILTAQATVDANGAGNAFNAANQDNHIDNTDIQQCSDYGIDL